MRIQGGLGNQLFEYVAALELACQRSSDVVVYGSETAIESLEHALGLTLARVEKRFDTSVPAVLRPDATPAMVRLSIRMMGRAASWQSNLLRQSPTTSHDPPPSSYGRLINSKRPVVLDGYFQHPQYAARATQEVATALADRVTGAHVRPGTIGVHLRRGDYVTLGYQLSIDFYETAVTQIDPKHRCSVLVASDDRMAAAHLCDRLQALGWQAELAEGTREPHEDMLTLASCQHYVMSNSTYSWWAANVGDIVWSGHGRVVISPDPWAPGHGQPTPPGRWHSLRALLERDQIP